MEKFIGRKARYTGKEQKLDLVIIVAAMKEHAPTRTVTHVLISKQTMPSKPPEA